MFKDVLVSVIFKKLDALSLARFSLTCHAARSLVRNSKAAMRAGSALLNTCPRIKANKVRKKMQKRHGAQGGFEMCMAFCRADSFLRFVRHRERSTVLDLMGRMEHHASPDTPCWLLLSATGGRSPGKLSAAYDGTRGRFLRDRQLGGRIALNPELLNNWDRMEGWMESANVKAVCWCGGTTLCKGVGMVGKLLLWRAWYFEEDGTVRWWRFAS